jgi:PhnB protein
MTKENTKPEAEIRALIADWSRAIERRDLDGIVANYTEKTVLFDAIPPFRSVGKSAIRALWEQCLPYFPERFRSEHKDLAVEADGDVAFVHGLHRFIPEEVDHPAGMTNMRVTACYRRIDGRWTVAHEHVSVPFNPMTSKAVFEKPGSEGEEAKVSSAVERAEAMGIHRVTPHLVCAGAAKAIDFYKEAFGATEMVRMPTPDGRLMHAALSINGSSVMLVDEFPEMGGAAPTTLKGSPVTMHLTVDDADAAAERAVKAGATIVMPVADQFWGDRYGLIADPFGHLWSIATPGEAPLDPAEIAARAGNVEMNCGPGAA